MGGNRLTAFLTATAVVTIVAMAIAAGRDNQALAAIAAGIFMANCAVVAWLSNIQPESSGEHTQTKLDLAATNAALLAATFAWGGAAILAAYYLTDLFWQHAWQYGIGMLLVAGGIIHYRNQLLQPGAKFASPEMLRKAAQLSVIQLCAALVGLGFLLISGKLWAGKMDWLANHVFLAGGVLVVFLSFLAARAQFRA